MKYFFIRRTITALFVLLGASFLTYAMMMLAPGDASLEVALARYGGEGVVDRATVEWIREKEGLDRPFIQQYIHWMSHVVKLDFGRSLVDEVPVTELIASRLPRTLELASAAMFLSFLLAIPLGISAGVKQGSGLDSLGVTVAVFGVSIPNYWLGLLLILLFGVHLSWLPTFGHGTWRHLILPAVTLGTGLTAYTTRILRSAVAEAAQAEFLMSLRARGAGSPLNIGRHVLKNALVPVITVVGMEIGMLMEGAVITETVFSWPGIGELTATAISNRDYPLIQALVLLTATVFVLINFLVDLGCRSLDPRIRLT